MESFLVSAGTVALAEMGDRTQLIALMLAARYRKPWPIICGILVATSANHAIAGAVGVAFGSLLTPQVLSAVVGVSLIAMGAWLLKPDVLDSPPVAKDGSSIFLITLGMFFVAEFGDKTQLATVALAAAYPHPALVVLGTTVGLLVANAPIVFLGNVFSRLPMKLINVVAAVVFLGLGVVFLARSCGWI
jgi:putative Ca2+/H+ antiporter (TMEM165/GDT1 family)